MNIRRTDLSDNCSPGCIVVNGKKLSMYSFNSWLVEYNSANNTKYRPSNAPDNVIVLFVSGAHRYTKIYSDFQ